MRSPPVLLLLCLLPLQSGCERASGTRGVSPSETFREPPVLTSENGVLQTTLEVKPMRMEVGGRPVMVNTYNGLPFPPTLRVKPGDTIRLRLVNGIDRQTNIHYHGFNVSPRGNSDNIFLHIRPGQSFDYEVVLPENHPAGLFWYHSHAHNLSEYQVMSGMSGAIIVEGLLDPLRDLRDVRERVLLLKDIQIDSDSMIPDTIDSNAGTTRR